VIAICRIPIESSLMITNALNRCVAILFIVLYGRQVKAYFEHYAGIKMRYTKMVNISWLDEAVASMDNELMTI